MDDPSLDTGISVITIVLDDAKIMPEVHLDQCPPELAVVIFSKAIEALKEVMPRPTVSYNGNIIYSDFYLLEDEDENPNLD